MQSRVYITVWYAFICLSDLLSAATSCGFAAVGLVGRRSRSIAARLAPQHHEAAAADGGSATFTADAGSCCVCLGRF